MSPREFWPPQSPTTLVVSCSDVRGTQHRGGITKILPQSLIS
ncbi:unnamed protein product [Gulo gulo]|uniref:Uncharacterized protein n=1 Tax=Gulo gulo TaxID=48420 RepID=A0A9X9LV87_GULGU|nr:unnamed protein product [Gulo gulo]